MRHAFALVLGLVLGAQTPVAPPQNFVLLGSTIGPIDSGVIDVLEERFEAETGIRVRHVGAGTGAVLDMAKRGGLDLLLVHAKALEEAFVAEGFGTERIPLMYNDFVLLGPAADPAGIRGMRQASEAMKLLATKAALFVTRGDNSGTHVAELELWKRAGVAPSGAWYQTFEKGSQGNLSTLLYADQQGAYTLMDRATYLAQKDKIHLVVCVEGDEALLNHLSLIPVNPRKWPRVNAKAAAAFSAWLTDPAKGQKLIAEFGKARVGQSLFTPEAKPRLRQP